MLFVALDEVLFGQELTNVLENALRLSQTDPSVEVRIIARPRLLVIEVADRGPGITPGEETRIFEKFYRGVGSRDQRGAGLGLTIARGIVEAHGGELTAMTREGGGAILRISLPIVGEPPVVERTEEERTDPA